MISTGEQIWLVLCFGSDDEEEVHSFSTVDRATSWASADDRVHLIFSSVLDHPELAHMVTQ